MVERRDPGDPNIPQKDSEPIQYSFSLTKAVDERFQNMGITAKEAAYFCTPLDGYLQAIANPSHNIGGIGLSMEFEEDDRLPYIEIYTYWNKEVTSSQTPGEQGVKYIYEEWKNSPTPKEPCISEVFCATGTIDHPSYEAIREHLKVDTSIGFIGPQQFLPGLINI